MIVANNLNQYEMLLSNADFEFKYKLNSPFYSNTNEYSIQSDKRWITVIYLKYFIILKKINRWVIFGKS